jgi:hypothetical protein
MKRDFSPQDNRMERRFGEHRGGSCIALIDGRFLMWLAQQGATGATGESVNRQGLLNLLSIALSQSGLDVDLRRIYWYSDRPDGLVIDDQIVRLVQTHDADGGASLIRSLGHDLKQLAQQHACDHVLVASDDERFLALIDDAQLGGLSVHILADECGSRARLRSSSPASRSHAFVQRVRAGNVQDALQAVGGGAAGLLDQEAHRVGLVHQAQLAGFVPARACPRGT